MDTHALLITILIAIPTAVITGIVWPRLGK